ncbi:MAG TPA: RNA polymerase sigma factor [Phaeodactylibacter sp.]|nr:RNA polymerase sigma factor [Phaeodactylibacter sp.]
MKKVHISHQDQHYIEALLKGDNQAIEEIYSKYSKRIYIWVTANNGSASDAKDLFQDALLSIFTKATEKDFQLTCSLGALLFTICKNRWIDQLRKKNIRLRVRSEIEKRYYENDSNLESIVEKVQEAALKESLLNNAFLQLSELCQRLLQLVANGLSAIEIVKELSLNNPNTYYRRKNACIERWRNIFHSTNNKTNK